MSCSRLTAIVLAGGRSRRMGQDKATLLVAGEPLLKRTCRVALECTKTVWVFTPWVERYREIVPPGCRLIMEVQGNPDGSQGPLLGFAQVLPLVATEWVLLLACDLPRLEGRILRRWSAQCQNCSNPILLPRGEKGWEPLCGFYRTSCRDRLDRAIAQGCTAFQPWLASETVQELALEPGDRPLLLNCNTPEDWAKAGVTPAIKGSALM